MKSVFVRRSMWTLAGFVVVVAGMVWVRPAQGQADMAELTLILQSLTQMNSTMSTQQAPALTAAAASSTSQQVYQQQVVYPPSAIVQALAAATKMLSTISSIQALVSTPLNSATLPGSIALESQILGGNTASIGSISSSYSSLYGPLPASTSMTPHAQMALDMSDAAAQASLKKAVALDAIATKEAQLAQQLMQGLGTSSPGAASLIAAQAAAWNLQADAYTQGGYAQLLRLQAANTAYTGQQTKKAIASQFPSMSGAQ